MSILNSRTVAVWLLLATAATLTGCAAEHGLSDDAREDSIDAESSGTSLDFGPFTISTAVPLFACGVTTSRDVVCGEGAPAVPAGKFWRIAAGGRHVCGIRDEDRHVVQCWGDDRHRQLGGVTQVSTEADFSQVVSGADHSCALMSDGNARCWGGVNDGDDIDKGQTSIPERIQGQIRQLSAGAYHTCALTRSGEAVCWGAGQVSTCRAGLACKSLDYGQSAAPADERFIQVAAGVLHTCGLRDNGSVVCWGRGMRNSGGYDVGQAMPQPGPFQFISAGLGHTCGLADGKVECWGGAAPPLDAATDVARVYTGIATTCELHTTGSVSCSALPATGVSWLNDTQLLLEP